MRSDPSCFRPMRPFPLNHVLAIAVVLSVLAPAAALAIPYTVVRTPEVLQQLPISGGGPLDTILTTSADDMGVRWTMPPGFNFNFYATTHNAVTVSTNGYITFNPSSRGTDWTPNVFPSTEDPTDVLAVWWADGYCDANDIRGQVLGTPPNRQYVIEWNCRRLGQSNKWRAQAWLTEGSSTMSVVYGTFASPSDYAMTVIGVQNTGGTEYTFGLACGANCSGPSWPTNTRVTYTQGPELAVQAVTAPVEGFAGMPLAVSATVRNVGGQPATNFTNQFWVSPVPAKTIDSIPLGINAQRQSAIPGQSVTFAMSPVLPITLDPGSYYILALADPDLSVPLTNRGSTLGVSAPFVVGVPAPNLAAPSVIVPETVEPGSSFTVSWTAENTGNAAAVRAPYHIVLSTHDTPGLSSRVLSRGTFDLEKLSEREMEDVVTLPPDADSGIYYVGVLIDPDMVVYEHDKSNNVGVSNAMQVASPDSLAIVTAPDLPVAELGTPYSIAMEAVGGDGTYLWSVAAGHRLPPGLYLEETPMGAREAGLPFVTLLAGSPSILGDFQFGLDVESAGVSKSQVFRLHVGLLEIPLAITTKIIPDGNYQSEYGVRLASAGGTPPYVWSMDMGRLPGGVLLSTSGGIEGRPMEAGPFDFTARVTDSNGVSATHNYMLVVLPPARITCGTEALPPHRINEPYEERLHAAGGAQPVWSNQMIYYLASGPGERWEMHEEQAPPGIVLGQDGRVSGTPTRAGLYDWFVEIKDAANNTNDRTSCAIRVEILRDQNLTVLTRSLPDAVVGQRYSAQLEASGGEGEVRWSIGGDERLPAGLSLSAEGIISGIPTGAELAGETAGSISFMVRAADLHNRVDTAAMSVTLYALPRGSGPTEAVKTVSSCQSAGAEPSLLLVAAVVGLAAIRRRRRRD